LVTTSRTAPSIVPRASPLILLISDSNFCPSSLNRPWCPVPAGEAANSVWLAPPSRSPSERAAKVERLGDALPCALRSPETPRLNKQPPAYPSATEPAIISHGCL